MPILPTELPWTKPEIIEAMTAEYESYRLKVAQVPLVFIQFTALCRLGFSDKAPIGFGQRLADRLPQGAPFTELEDAVFARLGRVLTALREP
jgi:hypothetical protein